MTIVKKILVGIKNAIVAVSKQIVIFFQSNKANFKQIFSAIGSMFSNLVKQITGK